MNYSSPKSLFIAWSGLTVTIAVWALIVFWGVPAQSWKLANWPWAVYFIGILIFLAIAGLLLVLTLFGMTEWLVRRHRARVLGIALADVPPRPLTYWLARLGWAAMAIIGLGMVLVVVAASETHFIAR